jgi:AcrR family transcriptional regulator
VALISHYFGSKQGLFAASMTLPVSPAAVLDKALAGDRQQLGERVLAAAIATWDDPAIGGALKMLVITAMQDDTVLRALREYVEREIIQRVAERLGGGPDATARASALMTTVAGVIFTRYLLGLEPMKNLPADEFVRRLSAVARAPRPRFSDRRD